MFCPLLVMLIGLPAGHPVVRGADLVLTIMASPNPVPAGAILTYAITVRNNGPESSHNPVLTVAVPDGTTLQEFRAPRGSSGTAPQAGGIGTITCTSPSLPRDASAVFLLVVRVNRAARADARIRATARVSSRTIDPHAANNSVSVATTVKRGY